jgi:phosphate transport system substrate-binding protein
MLSVASGASHSIKGRVRIDGSSTVAPLMMVAAELFAEREPGVRVSVGVSGTGGGFKRFLEADAAQRPDVNNASRAIAPSELERARQLGLSFIELPIALDGIAVVVNPANAFCDALTVEELKKIWSPGSTITNWKDVRAGFPDAPLKLYGPGTDSGTFDFFTEAVVGKARACRPDFTASENDNVLVNGVAGDPGGLGYFGFSYYEANAKKIKLLGIDPGDGKPVKPDLAGIRGGAYRPLSRPLFLYVSAEAARRAEVRSFFQFFFENARAIVENRRAPLVAFDPAVYPLLRRRFERGVTGSVLAAGKTFSPDRLTELYGGD